MADAPPAEEWTIILRCPRGHEWGGEGYPIHHRAGTRSFIVRLPTRCATCALREVARPVGVDPEVEDDEGYDAAHPRHEERPEEGGDGE